MSVRQKLFKYRGLTPIPFFIVMVIFAEPLGMTILAGGAILVIGEMIRFWGVAYAGPLTRVTGNVGAPSLIVSGPFSFVRNPLYVGNILMYAGIGVMANALHPWLVLTAVVYFVFQYSMIVSLEEEFLEKEFGASYVAYTKAVPRFLPRLSPFRDESQASQTADWRGSFKSERRTLQAILLVTLVIVVRWLWG